MRLKLIRQINGGVVVGDSRRRRRHGRNLLQLRRHVGDADGNNHVSRSLTLGRLQLRLRRLRSWLGLGSDELHGSPARCQPVGKRTGSRRRRGRRRSHQNAFCGGFQIEGPLLLQSHGNGRGRVDVIVVVIIGRGEFDASQRRGMSAGAGALMTLWRRRDRRYHRCQTRRILRLLLLKLLRGLTSDGENLRWFDGPRR